jgi:sensor histidine kinase YesM
MQNLIKKRDIIKLNNYKIIVLLVISIFYGSSLYCQEYKDIKNITIKDGLPSNVVYGIKQDSKGFIWATTNKGVVRYDGRKFKLYTVEDGLPSNDNFVMLLDSKDNVWLYSFKAVCKIGADGEIKTYVETNSNFSYFKINELDEVYFRVRHKRFPEPGYSQYNYYKISDNKVIEYDFIGAESLFETYSIFFLDHKLTICSYTSKNSLVSNKTISENYTYGDSLSNSILVPKLSITHKFPIIGEFINVNDSISILMSSSNYKVYKFNQPQIEKAFPFRMRKFTVGNAYYYDGNLLILFDKGIYKLDLNSDSNGTFKPFIDIPMATGILYDKDGSFWVTTLGKGVYKIPKYLAYSENPICKKIDESRVVKLSGYKNEKLWFVNSSNEVKEYYTKRKYKTTSLSDLRFIENDSAKLFYGGSNAFYIDNKLVFQFGFKSISIKDETIIISSSFGMNFLSKNNPYIPKYKNQYLIGDIEGRMIAVLLLDDFFYCGNENGLFYGRRDSKTLTPICLSETESTISVNGILKSSDGLIWISTEGFGIFILENNKPIKHFTNELLDLNIHSMRTDNRNNIWVSTRLGVNKISKNDSNYEIQKITSYHGLPSNYINDTYCYDDILYVATDEGLAKLNLNDLNEEEFNKAPLVYLLKSRVSSNGKRLKIDLNENNSFDFNQNTISFEYTGISLRSNGKIGFEYRLLPSITNWTATTNDNITFNSLAPGSYKFEVRAINAIGIKSEFPASYSFTINKHYTQTTWFFILIALLLVALSVLVVSTYFRYKRKRFEEANKTQKTISELRLKSLQSQMNPHFIFNSLNAIQQFINVENRRAANDYLARFARLMRLYLGGSENQFISLEQEMEVIRLYCQLEHLRFADKYEYEIKIQPGLDLSQVKVPAMLLQPHVENAIRHGLVPSGKDDNFLNVEVYKLGEGILCSIKDNGVGRSKSLELKMYKQERHRSLGNKISKERLEVIRDLKLANITETIDDVICDNMICGTEVRIFIGF